MSTVNSVGKKRTDSRVFFRRPDESIYAVLPASRVKWLRRYHKLESFLKTERDSGVIITVNGND